MERESPRMISGRRVVFENESLIIVDEDVGPETEEDRADPRPGARQ
jgi:hypothetical protein